MSNKKAMTGEVFRRAGRVPAAAILNIREHGILRGIRNTVNNHILRYLSSVFYALYCHSYTLYARVLRRPVIHVTGDSHVNAFRWKKPFVAHHLGAATAHNLKKRDSATNSNQRLFKAIRRIKAKDVLILVFGEIDCRIHAYYQFRKNNEKQTINEILDLTVSNYGEVIEEIRRNGISPCIHSVSPATTVGNEYNFPFYATPEVRSEITRMFNEKLKAFCMKNGYTYIDVYSMVSDGDGMMLPEYAADKIHLNSKAIDLVKMELSGKLGQRF